MKDFFSFKYFQEQTILFVLEILLVIMAYILYKHNNFHIDFWDWKPFCLSLFIWSISSIVDKKLYFNLATLLSTGSFMYFLLWAIFNIKITH